MRFKRKITTWICVGLCSLGSAPGLAAAGMSSLTSLAENDAKETHTEWHLSSSKIVSHGKTFEAPEGWVISDYILEVQAESVLPLERFRHGVFLIKLHLFSPRHDMPGQNKGVWYLRGDWRLIDSKANPEVLSTRHNPYVFSGLITAELPFNPINQKGDLSAKVTHKMLLKEPMGRSRNGEFYGNERFEGTLLLPLLLSSANPNEQGGAQ